MGEAVQKTNGESCYLEVGGRRVFCLRAGSVPPQGGTVLVLLHGIGGRAENWNETIGYFSGRCRVYAPDILGFGRSDKPKLSYLRRDFTQFLKAFLVSVSQSEDGAPRDGKRPKIVLVGNSMGGAIALAFAADCPGPLDALVLVAPAGLSTEVAIPYRLATMPWIGELMRYPVRFSIRSEWKFLFHDDARVTNAFVEEIYQFRKTHDSRRTYLRVMRNYVGLAGPKFHLLEDAARIDVPTLLVWGAQDRVLPPEQGFKAVKLFQNARIEVFEDCGHLPQLEKPHEFNLALEAFLDRWFPPEPRVR